VLNKNDWIKVMFAQLLAEDQDMTLIISAVLCLLGVTQVFI